MNLDDAKNKTRKITAPDMAFTCQNLIIKSSDDLVEVLKALDEKTHKKLRQMSFFMIIASALFAFSFIMSVFVPASKVSTGINYGIGLLAFAYVMIGLISRVKSKIFSDVTYTEPVNHFLKKAEKRYRIFNPIDLTYSIPLLVVLFISGYLTVTRVLPRYFGKEHEWMIVLIYSGFFALVVIMGCTFTYLDYRKEKGKAHDEIVKMMAQMNIDESV